MNKQQWNEYYRQKRIRNREFNKSLENMLMFGTGYYLTTENNKYVNHVLVESIAKTYD